MLAFRPRPAEGWSMAEPQLRRMTQDDFFAWQERQDRLYELVDGDSGSSIEDDDGSLAGARPGGRQHHCCLTSAIARNTMPADHRRSCRPHPVPAISAVPMSRSNAAKPGRRELAVREPRVVIEVLSPSTMSFDRIRKLPEYQTIASVGAHPAGRYRDAAHRPAVARQQTERLRKASTMGFEAHIDLPRDPGIAQACRCVRRTEFR